MSEHEDCPSDVPAAKCCHCAVERVREIIKEQARLARQAREIGRDEGNPDAWESVAEKHEEFADQIRMAVREAGR